jgi:hypothetical protein
LFEYKEILPLKCSIQAINILKSNPEVYENAISNSHSKVTINEDIPWDLFNGAS